MTTIPDWSVVGPRLLEALEQTRRPLSWAINRIHTLPRTSDTELERRLIEHAMQIDAAIAAAKGEGA